MKSKRIIVTPSHDSMADLALENATDIRIALEEHSSLIERATQENANLFDSAEFNMIEASMPSFIPTDPMLPESLADRVLDQHKLNHTGYKWFGTSESKSAIVRKKEADPLVEKKVEDLASKIRGVSILHVSSLIRTVRYLRSNRQIDRFNEQWWDIRHRRTTYFTRIDNMMQEENND